LAGGLYRAVNRCSAYDFTAFDAWRLSRSSADTHRLPALPAQQRSSYDRLSRWNHDPQHQLHSTQQGLAAVVQQAVVAAASKPPREHVGEQQPKEIHTRQAAGAQLAAVRIAVSEAHEAAVDIGNIGFAEHAALEVGREVGQRVLAVTDEGAVRDPVFARVGRRALAECAQALRRLAAELSSRP